MRQAAADGDDSERVLFSFYGRHRLNGVMRWRP
jgi:hypothetical protein